MKPDPDLAFRLEPHRFTGLRQWGMRPTDDKRCVHTHTDRTVCGMTQLEHAYAEVSVGGVRVK